MSPSQHGIKLPSVLHTALQRREEDLRSVGEDDDSHRDEEVFWVHRQRKTGPRPAAGTTQTVQHDQQADREAETKGENALLKARVILSFIISFI